VLHFLGIRGVLTSIVIPATIFTISYFRNARLLHTIWTRGERPEPSSLSYRNIFDSRNS
jgi:hypothetical protein